MKNLAIIPARSGSKGVRDKNIRLLNGKPLMAYTIDAALKCGEFDEVMVSTDSENYADIAREFGARVPFIRSSFTASDTASSWDMVEEVLEGYSKMGWHFDTFCLLQPTSPLRTAIDIKNAYALYKEKARFSVVSVCEAEHSPLWCGHLSDSLELTDFINRDNMRQRQKCEKYYRINGAIYIVNTSRFLVDHFLYQPGSYAYVMDQENSVDIDTEADFLYAEVMIRNR